MLAGLPFQTLNIRSAESLPAISTNATGPRRIRTGYAAASVNITAPSAPTSMRSATLDLSLNTYESHAPLPGKRNWYQAAERSLRCCVYAPGSCNGTVERTVGRTMLESTGKMHTALWHLLAISARSQMLSPYCSLKCNKVSFCPVITPPIFFFLQLNTLHLF